MGKMLRITLLAVLLLSAQLLAAEIFAGGGVLTFKDPSIETKKVGTGAGGAPVTNTYLVDVENRLGQELCDLIITLEDEKGKQIPADANNDIESVSVQNQKNGTNQGAEKTYDVGGANSTQAKVTIDPCIPYRSDPSDVQAGAKLKIKAKTDKNFIRIHISFSKKEPGTSDHYTIGQQGAFSFGPGHTGALYVSPRSGGVVFFVENPLVCTDTIERGLFRLIGDPLPNISGVTIEGAQQAFTVDVDADQKGFSISGGALAAGRTMEVWVKFSADTTGDAALLGKLMSD